MRNRYRRALAEKRRVQVDPKTAARRLDAIENALRARPPLEELSELLGVEVEEISVHVPGLRAASGKPIRMAPGTWLITLAVRGSKNAVRVRVKSAWLRSPAYLTQLAG